MADFPFPNYALNSTDNYFSAIWKMTRCMKAAGWNVVAHSNGAAKTAAGTNNNDSWGNNANPMLDAYPAFDVATAWIVMSGPTTLKLPITGPPSGTFLRGEQVVQAVSGATGEVLGTVWDTSTASGWAVVAPRTGTFNGVNLVGGSVSGATFQPSSVKVFVREVVFFKANTTVSGTAYYICADQVAENAQLFSVLAASAGATAAIAPGAGGVGNAFPTLGLCVRGTGGSVAHTNWNAATASAWTAFAMVGAVNATPAAGTTADGSFYCYVGRSALTNSVGGFIFSRLDDTEPGDVDPYIWAWNQGQTPGTWARTTATSFAAVQQEEWSNFMNTGFTMWKGYVARDCPVISRDIPSYFYGMFRACAHNAFLPALNNGQPNFHSVQNHPNATPPFVRDMVGVMTQNGAIRMFKGTVRWMQLASIGTLKDTLDAKRWMCITPFANAVNPAIYIGPLDGITAPT